MTNPSLRMSAWANGTSGGMRLPYGVSGFADPHFAASVNAFAYLFRANRTGGALTVYQRGELVVDVWAGVADDKTGTPWRRNTATVPYSSTKGISAMVLHRLADRGLIDYNAPVSEYWREFAKKGKGSITVRDVLTHRAGLASVQRLATSIDDFLDHELMEDRLAAAQPDGLRGTPSYHSLTFGWLVGGIARRVTGHTMTSLFQQEIAAPLGTDELYLGRPPADAPIELSRLTGSLQVLNLPVVRNIVPLASWAPGPLGRFMRSIYTSHFEELLVGSTPRILEGEIPGANSVVTARALASMYNMVACDGLTDTGRMLSSESIRELSRVQARQFDRTLGLPGWRLGFHSFPVPGAMNGFGHIGLVGSGGWVDPASGTAVGFIHNRVPQASSFVFDQTVLAWLLPLIMRGVNVRPRIAVSA